MNLGKSAEKALSKKLRLLLSIARFDETHPIAAHSARRDIVKLVPLILEVIEEAERTARSGCACTRPLRAALERLKEYDVFP